MAHFSIRIRRTSRLFFTGYKTIRVSDYRAQNEAYKSGRPSTGVNGLLFSWLHCSAANGDAKRNV